MGSGEEYFLEIQLVVNVFGSQEYGGGGGQSAGYENFRVSICFFFRLKLVFIYYKVQVIQKFFMEIFFF